MLCGHSMPEGILAKSEIPTPASRIPSKLYLELRDWLLENDPDARRIIEWSNQRRTRPESPERMAADIIWIVLCAGRSAQAARTIEKRVWEAIQEGRPVVSAFGFRAKAEAIERAWRERAADFLALQDVLSQNDLVRLVEWCGSLPWVGDDTKYQLSKNFGEDVCKPDIWLCRLTGIPDKPRRRGIERFEACMQLCRTLSEGSGDSIATVDSVLWLACNKGVLQVSPQAGPVTFTPMKISRTEIIPEAEESTNQ
ncbi:hypothetical protein ACUXLG_006013 [Ralstonia sp. 121560039-2]